jgi:hypothetical protein
MSSAEIVRGILNAEPTTHQVGSQVAVTTHCMYPSNSAVTVFVMGGDRECVVSDNGETARMVRSHGVTIPESGKWLNSFCKRAGLTLVKEQIQSPPVPISALSNAIMLVANTAATAARHAIDQYGSERVSLKDKIHQTLSRIYSRNNISVGAPIVGESTRVYHPDFLVHTATPLGIIVDSVTPHANSINAKAAAHIDIGRLERRPLQTIVYDASLDWSSADLSFLKSTTAELVPYEKLPETLASRQYH